MHIFSLKNKQVAMELFIPNVKYGKSDPLNILSALIGMM